MQRKRASQYFNPRPICIYHGPRYTSATLTQDITNNNDYIWEHPHLDLYIDGAAPLSSHARAMNEESQANNSELRWIKGELWEGDELFGAYELQYWRGKGDPKVLELAEVYYEECRKRIANEKPLGTKVEDRWEMLDSKKKKRTQRRKRQQAGANSSAAKEVRN